MRESDIEDYLIKCVTYAGGGTRKLKWIGQRHAPDRLVLLRDYACFVELKAPGKKPNAGQIKEHKRLRWAGLDVKVIDSYLGVELLVGGRAE